MFMLILERETNLIDQFGYRFQDDKHKKNLRYCNMTFDDDILYKDKIEVQSEDVEKVRVQIYL